MLWYYDSEHIPFKFMHEYKPPTVPTHTLRPIFNLLRLLWVPRQAYFHPGRHRPIDGNAPPAQTARRCRPWERGLPLHVVPASCCRTSWRKARSASRASRVDDSVRASSGPPLNHLIGTHILEALGAPIEPVLANLPSPVGRLTNQLCCSSPPEGW